MFCDLFIFYFSQLLFVWGLADCSRKVCIMQKCDITMLWKYELLLTRHFRILGGVFLCTDWTFFCFADLLQYTVKLKHTMRKVKTEKY